MAGDGGGGSLMDQHANGWRWRWRVAYSAFSFTVIPCAAPFNRNCEMECGGKWGENIKTTITIHFEGRMCSSQLHLSILEPSSRDGRVFATQRKKTLTTYVSPTVKQNTKEIIQTKTKVKKI
jgi:hypothetical protein